MRVLRVFIKPDGRHWFDYPIPDGATVGNIEQLWRTDGVLVHDSGLCPYNSMLMAYTFEGGMAKPAVVVSPPQWSGNKPPAA